MLVKLFYSDKFSNSASVNLEAVHSDEVREEFLNGMSAGYRINPMCKFSLRLQALTNR